MPLNIESVVFPLLIPTLGLRSTYQEAGRYEWPDVMSKHVKWALLKFTQTRSR